MLTCIFYAGAQEKSTDTLCCSTQSCADCCRAGAYAPGGIMTDHVHERGVFSLAYSFMQTGFSGNQSGATAVTDQQLFYNQGYMMAPQSMRMQMHMLMPMYGITDKLSVMAMLSYNINTMQMHMMPAMNMPGMSMSDNSSVSSSSSASGLGDTKLYVLYNLLKSCRNRLVAGAGLSLPTGKIALRGATTQSYDDVLPYCMQTGTGSFALLPSLVYVGQTQLLTFGAAANANLKTGANSRNYNWGNEYAFSPWIAYKVRSIASFSLRGEIYMQDKLKGYDADINQSAGNDPTAKAANYGQQQKLNVYAGINLYAPSTCLKGARLFVEYGLPVWQNLAGLQMPQTSALWIRLQYDFNSLKN